MKQKHEAKKFINMARMKYHVAEWPEGSLGKRCFFLLKNVP